MAEAVAEAKAVGKVMTEKPIYADGLAIALGRAWCPLKGIRCKSMGGNVFLLTFVQESGKHKALKGGPWMMNNDLIVLEEYDPMKRINEYKFDSVPIWIRVFRLPLGLMDRDVGELIGNGVGEFMEVEVGDDDRAEGEYLKVKVRTDIKKPLMRGTMMQFGEKGNEPDMERWLSFCWLGSLSLLLAVLLILIPSTGKKKLPPGPWTLPIIGCLHHIVKLLPHRALMELSRQHGPLMLLKLGQVPTLVVSGADEAALVMKTNGLVFASRPASVTQKIFGCGGKGINFAPYGDHWRRMRKLCIRELLCPKQVRRMERIRVEEVRNLIHNIAASASTGATINFSHKMVELGNNVVFRAVFGAKCTSQEEFLRELDTAFVLLGGFFLVDLFPSSRLLRWLSHVERDMTQSCSRIHRIITNNIHERRVVRAAGEEACSTDDEVLVDVLLRLQQEDLLDFPLTTEIISAVLFVSVFVLP
ncbi:hypothetical protein ZWY2020_019380 [Hordeum vulgare]|nr:hypothetical protein ZWY2020_019380 [Hordeum vulgare]